MNKAYRRHQEEENSSLGLPLTVNILLNGKPDENVIVNNAIFRRVQLYILATKRFTS